MKKAIVSRIYVWIVLLAVVAVCAGCGGKPAPEAAEEGEKEALPGKIGLSAEAIKTAGIETVEATMQTVGDTLLVPGEIVFNPKLRAHVTARAGGRIERMAVYAGEPVKAGQVLLTLYSQDFLALQAELLQASQRFARLQGDAAEKKVAQALLDSVRDRVRLLGLTDAEITEIERTQVVKPLLPVRAPLGGTVVAAMVTSGDFVELGAALYDITDASSVRADLHFPEKHLSVLRVGLEIAVRATAAPERTFRGRLFQVGQVVDEKTRTVEGLVELANPDRLLRQGMYVQAEVRLPQGLSALFIPASALQDVQGRRVVFVQGEADTFLLREVETGAESGGLVEIRQGLREKERVVTNGAFFLKSELLKSLLGEE